MFSQYEKIMFSQNEIFNWKIGSLEMLHTKKTFNKVLSFMMLHAETVILGELQNGEDEIS